MKHKHTVKMTIVASSTAVKIFIAPPCWVPPNGASLCDKIICCNEGIGLDHVTHYIGKSDIGHF